MSKASLPVRRIPQDLHIHTTFSRLDSAVVPEQTVALVAAVRHAEVMGISDHLESVGEVFDTYADEVRAHGLHVGTEVNGAEWVPLASQLPAEYYVYHCRDRSEDYRGAEQLLGTGRPVIIAHPLVLHTNLERVPPACLIEINNRYVWRDSWQEGLGPYVGRFRFILGSDAHQPHRYVARELGVRETILFRSPAKKAPALSAARGRSG
jgi:histidinol phosphatase-like PHP family hydrolase